MIQPLIHSTQVHADKMREALTMDMLATDLADYLVRKGVGSTDPWTIRITHRQQLQIPFRETHHISGRAVALAESRKCQLHKLSLEDYKGLSGEFTEDVHGVFDFEASVEKRQAIGGPALQMIDRQVETLQGILDK